MDAHEETDRRNREEGAHQGCDVAPERLKRRRPSKAGGLPNANFNVR
jgi:hypothetical protein